MDQKQAIPKNKILKFLPRAASFQNLPFSPGRSDKKAHAAKRFSGPLISMFPDEARRKSSKNTSSFETQEPTSPKISCMGQIKHKNRIPKGVPIPKPQASKPVPDQSRREIKKQASTIRRLFSSGKLGHRKSDASGDHKPTLPDRAPSISQTKRFASSRDSLANFDWTAPIAPVEADRRNYYADEDHEGESDHHGEEVEEEEDDVRIPFSAPILVGDGVALRPKKEVNLWKRRPMAPPVPLQLNTMVR